MSKEAMKLAHEALENWVEYFPQNVDDIDKKAITALETALAKPDFWEGYVPEPVKPAQQEPVACKTLCELCVKRGYIFCANSAQTTLIPSPPAQRTWVGLTNEQKLEAVKKFRDAPVALVFDIEAKLKEKNT